MNDELIEYVMWPVVIIANVAAYYYDLYYNNEHHELKEGKEELF